jgi:hypothetical protein
MVSVEGLVGLSTEEQRAMIDGMRCVMEVRRELTTEATVATEAPGWPCSGHQTES